MYKSSIKESFEKNTTIIYEDLYMLVLIWIITVFMLVVSIGYKILFLLFLVDTHSVTLVDLGLDVMATLYAIVFFNLKSWKISLNENEFVYKRMFFTVTIPYDELRILIMKKKIIVKNVLLKIPSRKGYIKVNLAKVSYGMYFKDILINKIGLDESAVMCVKY